MDTSKLEKLLKETFDERELGLIQNCIDYACGDTPSGLPGHNLMIVIDKLVRIIGKQPIFEAKNAASEGAE
jgi:hypothetical protein